MPNKTEIEWTNTTWNPVTGCTKISPGCDNCYAERFAERWRGTKGHPYKNGFDLTLRPERLTQPLSWREPRMIFVNSMSDLFHKEIPEEYIHRVFDTMEAADNHIFQVLTKRSSLMRNFVNKRYKTKSVPAHIWLGVSVEDAKRKSRIKHLQETNAYIKFLSLEPLLGALGPTDFSGIGWIIVGGESGPGAREMDVEWVREIRDLCLKQKIPFFFKQWGGLRPKSGGRTLDKKEWSQFPKMPKNASQPELLFGT